MLYHYIKDGITAEPVEENELIKLITPETLVWTEGMDDWIAAKDVPALTSFFPKKQTPPPPPQIKDKTDNRVKHKTTKTALGLSFITLLVLVITSMNKTVTDNVSSSGLVQAEKPAIQTNETPEQEELTHPKKYLSLTHNSRCNLMAYVVIEGDISNNATIINYKEIELEVKFMSKEGNVLEIKNFILTEEVGIGNKIHFIKKFPIYPLKTAKLDVSLNHAKGFIN